MSPTIKLKPSPPLLYKYGSETQRLIPKVSFTSSERSQPYKPTVRRLCCIIGRIIQGTVTVTILAAAIWIIPFYSIGQEGQANLLMNDTIGERSNRIHKLSKHCRGERCFTPSRVRVPAGREGFPSFWDYVHEGALNVSYDKRSLFINGSRALFLSGSLHPVRATWSSWNNALDEAVRNGLNMITVYVIWAAHQHFPDRNIDWTLPTNLDCSSKTSKENSCQWDLASAIIAAANRGLFVHIRLGPYVCAEYNYGGIPEWVAVDKPNISMRRPNKEWMDEMEKFVTEAVNYLNENMLWAHQGGPILLAQIENELGGDVDPALENLLLVDHKGKFVEPHQAEKLPIESQTLRNATLQDYADWCGSLAERLAPEVTWTMCNGLAANNTILTCNGECSTWWLENKGGTGRIQVDQPAILTEFEGGFQVWGEDPKHPSDYFWGRTARSQARDALRWFARGGTHLNHYMWWGGYNRGRAAGAGITNMYALDVCMCPSGERRQPKYGHFEALHEAISGIASTLLTVHSALWESKAIEYMDETGNWRFGGEQRMFEYNVKNGRIKHVAFVENDADSEVVIQIPNIPHNSDQPMTLEMSPQSVILLVDGIVSFDSASIDPRVQAFERKFSRVPAIASLLDRSTWQEPIGASSGDPRTLKSSKPIEQTALNLDSRVFSDYAWYETQFMVVESASKSTLFFDTQKASAFSVFVDNELVGTVDHHLKSEGPITFSIKSGALSQGEHKLSILSESLGYNNLIGRWGAGTGAKTKGLTGDVILSIGEVPFNVSLVDGREWRSYPGLHGESFSGIGEVRRKDLEMNLISGHSSSPTWSSALFDTPRYDPSTQALFLEITQGRGHLWLNGRDLGRFWNITREGSNEFSQRYYFLPSDYFHMDGSLNEIVTFDALGGEERRDKLVLSWTTASAKPNFIDEIDYPLECI